jgi:ParB family chromosome partitioning protein
MATVTEILARAGANLDESMGVRSADLRPNLAPVPDARDLGRRPLRNVGRVDIGQVVPDADQPRAEFPEESLDRLAASIRDRGQLAPIRVRWSVPLGKWVIIAGERRWRAALLAGLEAIDCVFVEGELSRGELLAQQLIENLLREDLRPVEEARAFRELLDLNGWTGKQLAEALRIPASKVTRSLALLDLPDDLQERVEAGELAARSAYEVAKLEGDEARRAFAETVRQQSLSAEEARQAVRQRRAKGQRLNRGTKLTFFGEDGWRVTVSATRKGTYHEVEQALALAIEEVRHRIDSGCQPF